MDEIRYRLSRRALADLSEIADYLKQHSSVAAERVLDSLLRAFEILAENNELGAPRDDLHPGLRMFVPKKPAHNFVILYYPIEGGIEVSDVVHAARDWLGLFLHGDR